MGWDDPPRPKRTLHVRVLQAEFHKDQPHATVRTYAELILLEPTRFRRRKVPAKPTHNPLWNDDQAKFTLQNVAPKAKLVVDVYQTQEMNNHEQLDQTPDDFVGKVTIPLDNLMPGPPMCSWYELIPGRIRIQLGWQSPMDSYDQGLPQVLQGLESSQDSHELEPPQDSSTDPANAKIVNPAPTPTRPAPRLDAVTTPQVDVTTVPPVSLPFAPPLPPLPSDQLSLKLDVYDYTHRGGSGQGPKENQDAHFVSRIDDSNYIIGVLDGHGGAHGRIASHAASRAIQDHLKQHFNELRSDPEEVMRDAFRAGHDAVWTAISKQADVFERDGMLCMEVDPDEWPLGYDAVDGGTTASIAAIIDGRRLIYAAVGDSAGVLAAGDEGSADIYELVEEHSPTRRDEWKARLSTGGAEVVYDVPDLFDEDDENLLRVFCRGESGEWQLDADATSTADARGCGFKTERGDRSTVIMTPESGPFSQMMLNVTRTLGDFYHQRYGVTWEPQVVQMDLTARSGKGTDSVLCVASDGVWDLWTFEDAMQTLLEAPSEASSRREHVLEFFEESRVRGFNAFGDSADNLTGVVLYFKGMH